MTADNLHCQLESIWSHLGDQPFLKGVSTRQGDSLDKGWALDSVAGEGEKYGEQCTVSSVFCLQMQYRWLPPTPAIVAHHTGPFPPA